jgi:hypothetical protein
MPIQFLSSSFISGLIGFLLTIMVLSYLIGDNPLFRIAIHIFVGVSAGYVALVAFYQVIWPQLILPFFTQPWPAQGLLFIPLILSILMIAKISPRAAWLGGPAVAYLVGVGAAVAVGGAALGTILPQVDAAVQVFAPGNSFDAILFSAVALLATIATLAYFHFGARGRESGPAKRNFFIELSAWVGRIFVALTLGALFSGVYVAALTALVERINSLFYFVFKFFLS